MKKPEKLTNAPVVASTPDEGLGTNPSMGVQGVSVARELFWQNVMREILTSLSSITSTKATPLPILDATGQASSGDLFDGRLAVITSMGQRIPIAAVHPLFACGIQTSDSDKALSMAVECTVFQIYSPGGEVYTIPLHEIRGFHSLSGELIEQIKQASQGQGGEGQEEPFGFAAYTSLAKSSAPAGSSNQAPDQGNKKP